MSEFHTTVTRKHSETCVTHITNGHNDKDEEFSTLLWVFTGKNEKKNQANPLKLVQGITIQSVQVWTKFKF